VQILRGNVQKRIILSNFDSTVKSHSKPNIRQANLYADVEEFANSNRNQRTVKKTALDIIVPLYITAEAVNIVNFWLSAKQVEESELETVTLKSLSSFVAVSSLSSYLVEIK